MKKNKRTRLTLDVQTIRLLSESETKLAVGGVGHSVTGRPVCGTCADDTDCFC